MALGHLFVAVLVLAGVFLLGLAAIGWRNRSRPGGRWFVGIAGFGAAWVLLDAIGLGLLDPGFPRLYVGNLIAVASICAAVCWVGFVLSYTGRSHWLTPGRLVALSAIPAATIAVLLVDPTSPLVQPTWAYERVSGLTLFSIDAGPLLLLVEGYLFLLIGGLFVVMLRTMVSAGATFRGQLWALIGGSLSILVGVAVDVLDLVPLDVIVTDVAVVVAVTAFALAHLRGQLLRLVPAVSHLGAGAAVADLDDGLVIADTDGQIVRCNPAAGDYLGVDPGRVVGSPVADHLPAVPLEEGEWTVDRRGRTYRVTTSAITRRGNRTVGWTVLLRDVTPLELREQRLAVLNRLLRHNLRNDVDAIQKHAAAVADRSDGTIADSAETIARLAMGLADLGDRARVAEEVLDVDPSAAESVAVGSLVTDLREDLLAAYPDASMDVVGEPSATVHSHRRVLEIALRNVLENAIEHTGPEPTVEVTITETATGVEVAVVDEGPGVPDSEVAVLEAGAESQLDHGSGIGLWLVHWAVAALEGDVSFETTDTGSRVAVRVPNLRDRASATGAPRED